MVYKNSTQKSRHVYAKVLMFVFLIHTKMYARHTILHIYGLQPNTTYSKKMISLKYNNKI